MTVDDLAIQAAGVKSSYIWRRRSLEYTLLAGYSFIRLLVMLPIHNFCATCEKKKDDTHNSLSFGYLSYTFGVNTIDVTKYFRLFDSRQTPDTLF